MNSEVHFWSQVKHTELGRQNGGMIYVENRKFWRQTDLRNLLLLNLY